MIGQHTLPPTPNPLSVSTAAAAGEDQPNQGDGQHEAGQDEVWRGLRPTLGFMVYTLNPTLRARLDHIRVQRHVRAQHQADHRPPHEAVVLLWQRLPTHHAKVPSLSFHFDT